MAINYEWKITAMKSAPSLDGLSDVITHINFEYKGTDEDGNEGVFNGACPIPAPDADNFTALASLTEADVIEWAKENHPTDHMNEVIEKQISDKITPKNVETDMPWAPVEEEPAAEEVVEEEEAVEEAPAEEEAEEEKEGE
tara:strand:- start:26 stop:448 length:423 start_codon:yes stop_codon:yes gene_type:complete